MTDRYVVIGNPVAHSRSPFIHAAFARQTGQDIAYDRLQSPLDGFEATVRAFAAGGGRGCNITVPFKPQVQQLAQRVTGRARLAGAANVLSFDDAGWTADNTDGAGLMRDIEVNADWPLAGQRVLLIGAGGAGAGVLGPLLEASPAEVLLVNRTADKAHALAASHAAAAAANDVVLRSGGLADAATLTGQGFDIVLNASASSLQGAASPVGPEVFAAGALAVDLMYGPAAQPWLQWAARLGAQTRDGLGMLVEQAAEAFFLWRGVRPDTAPVLAALREELARA